MNTKNHFLSRLVAQLRRYSQNALPLLVSLVYLVWVGDKALAATFTWTTQTAGGERPSLAFDANGKPAISFQVGGGGVKYTAFNGSQWSAAQNVDATGAYASLAFNPANGQAQIAFVNANNNIAFATLNGNWSVETVNGVDAAFDPSHRSPNLAIGATGKPHIGWGGPFNGNADYSYSTKVGGNWVSEYVEGPGGQPFTAEHSSLALNSQGVPAIIYNSHTNAGAGTYRTKYTIRTGGVWMPVEYAVVPVIIDGEPVNITAPGGSLKFGSSDVPHVAYVSKDGSLCYSTRGSDGNWTVETVAIAAADVFSVSLAIHPVTGVPYISFRDNLGDGTAALKLAHKTTGAWEVETVEAGLGNFSTSAAVDATGTTLGIAYNGKYAFTTISTALTITTSGSLNGGTVGRAYSKILQRINGTATFIWSKVSGSYPDGITLNASTGELSGTPTTANQNSSFRLRVTDGVSATAEKDFTLGISAAPAISANATLPQATLGLAYTQTVTVTGGTAPLTWSKTSGAIPDGVTLNAATGVLSGIPTAANAFTFTIQVTDANGATASKTFGLTVNNALALTATSPIPAATAGKAYAQTITAAGGTGSLVWSISSGALPAGWNINAGNGLISGTTTVTGTANFTVKVMDANSAMVTRDFAVTVNDAPVITTTSLPEGIASIAYSYQLVGVGGTGQRVWSKTGNLPAGLALSAGGLIAGTPTASGTFNLTFRVTDQNGAFVERALVLTVQAAPQGPNLSVGQTLYSQRCASCHNTTSFQPSAGASKLILDYKGDHQNRAISFLSDSAKTNLAFYISSLDAQTYLINGVIKDGANQGLAGVTVTATSGYLPMGSAVSGADGSYSITGLKPGDYLFKASKPGVSFTPAQRELAVTKDKYWLDSNIHFTAGVQPLLPPVSFTANLAPLVTLTEPLSYLDPMASKAFVAPAKIELTASAADPDGSITKVSFYADGQLLGNDFAPEVINTTLRFGITWDNVSARTNTLITAVATDNLGLNTTSAPVTIQVLAAIGAPNVSLANGLAIYVSQCNRCHGPNPGRNPTWQGIGLDANGSVIGKNEHPGYLASRYKIGREFLSMEYHALGGSLSVSNYLGNVITESEKSDLAAYLASSVPERTSIAGTVRNAAGQPLAGATVNISSSYNPSVSVTTDAAGKYRVEGLYVGDYTVSAVYGGIDPLYPLAYIYETYPGSSNPAIFLDRQRTLYVSHDANTPPVPLDFAPGHRIQGSVRNANNYGFKNILVWAAHFGTGADTALTDANGDYTLIVPDNDYLVSIPIGPSQPELVFDYTFAPASRSVAMAGSDQSGVNFTVTSYPTLTINGKLTGPTGVGMTGVTVALAEAPAITTTTDANGDYTLTSADPGTFTVTVTKANHLFTPANRVVTIGAGSRTGVNFTGLLNSFNITGTVRTPSTSSGPPFFNTILGEPIPNVAVSVPGQTVLTDTNGTYRLVLTNNNYTITAARSGYVFDVPAFGITVTGADQSGKDFNAGLLVAYASVTGNNKNDGSSWNSPKLSIQKAINITAKGGQVMVSGGVYYERIAFSGISLYGVGKPVLNGLPLPFGEQFPRGRMVEIDTSTGIGTNSTRLDGFVIINGLATSPNTGGGVYCKASDSEAGPVVIANNSIGDNVASFKGGGVFLIGKATITNNVINNNRSESGGGAGIQVDFGSSLVTIANNLIVGNRADNGGGGIGTFAGSILIANNTITENVVTNSGAGGIYFGAGFGSSTNANNIIAFNSSGLGTISSVVLNRNNCVFGNTNANYDVVTAGTGDVSVNPQFAEPAEFNYRLLGTSPLLDAGANSFLVGPADLDAAPRLEGATVDIGAYEYQAPNIAPMVALITPVNNASYSAPASFTLNAVAFDADGTVAKVEFYAGDFSLGSATVAPYTLSLNGLQVGTHELTAVVTDNRGARTVSEPVTVTVHPITDPAVAITSPLADANIGGPAQITITANATDSDGTITKVEFLVNGLKVGEDSTAPYTYTWANVSAGEYTLTAKATDNSGAVTTSTPVTIRVENAPQLQKVTNAYAGGEFRVPMQLEAGKSYLIQASSDLVNWTTLQAFTALGSAMEFVDIQAGSYPGRFYRLIQLE